MVKDKEDAKKSRSKTHIPRSISAPKPQLAEPRLLDSTIDRSEYIRESLLSIGAPDVSPEEMRRLCKGSLADALFFIAEHLKGRMEVNRVRTAIQQARDVGTSHRAASDGQPTEYATAKHAAARLKAAKNEFSSAKEQLDSRLRSLSNLQREATREQAALDSKRRMFLLLQVLERKETFRITRIKELDRLMSQKQTSSANPASNLATRPERTPALSSGKRSMRRIRADNTQDVLAALQAHHIRLPQADPRSNRSHEDERRRNASEARLRAALGDSSADLFEKCQRIARIRAERSLQYESPLPPHRQADDVDLDEMHARITAKERSLQHLLDEIADLEKACTKSLQDLSAFDELTRPALLQSLKEEVKTVDGYVDLMKLSITQSADEDCTPDEGLVEGKTWQRALLDTQSQLERAHNTDRFLQRAMLLSPSTLRTSTDDATVRELIASHQARRDQVSKRNTSLLARKLEKAKYGDALGAQIDRLVSEKDIVAALSGSSK